MAALQVNLDYSCKPHVDKDNDKGIPSCVSILKPDLCGPSYKFCG